MITVYIFSLLTNILYGISLIEFISINFNHRRTFKTFSCSHKSNGLAKYIFYDVRFNEINNKKDTRSLLIVISCSNCIPATAVNSQRGATPPLELLQFRSVQGFLKLSNLKRYPSFQHDCVAQSTNIVYIIHLICI